MAVHETCWQCCRARQAPAGRVYRLRRLRICSLVRCKCMRGFCQMKMFCSASVRGWKRLRKGMESPVWKPVMGPAAAVQRGRREHEHSRDARHPPARPELRFDMFSNRTAQGCPAKLGPRWPGGRAGHGVRAGTRALRCCGGC